MITSQKQKKSKQTNAVSFDLISKKVEELVKNLQVNVEQIINSETKKVKIKAGAIYAGQFTAEIQEIQNTYKNHLKKYSININFFILISS